MHGASGSLPQILQQIRSGTASLAELEHLLGLSQPSVSRQLRVLLESNQIVRIGSRRGARYALLNPIESIGARWPLRRIDERGTIHELGSLSALAANDWLLEAKDESFA